MFTSRDLNIQLWAMVRKSLIRLVLLFSEYLKPLLLTFYIWDRQLFRTLLSLSRCFTIFSTFLTGENKRFGKLKTLSKCSEDKMMSLSHYTVYFFEASLCFWCNSFTGTEIPSLRNNYLPAPVTFSDCGYSAVLLSQCLAFKVHTSTLGPPFSFFCRFSKSFLRCTVSLLTVLTAGVTDI